MAPFSVPPRERKWATVFHRMLPRRVFLYDRLRASKAYIFWQWYNHVASLCPAGKKILKINMDESSIAFFQGAVKGNVFFSKAHDDPKKEPQQRIKKSLLRVNLTLIAFICDDPVIQPLLPQIIVGNYYTFLQREMPTHLANTPRNVYLVRAKSAWNNEDLMIRVLGLLDKILTPYLSKYYVIFFMDAFGPHLTRPVWPVEY